MIAKKNGTTIVQHSFEVQKTFLRIIEREKIIIDKVYEFEYYNFLEECLCACRVHDDGKKNDFWQNKFRENNFDEKNVFRHEIESVKINKNLSPEVKLAVISHHNKLVKSKIDNLFNDNSANDIFLEIKKNILSKKKNFIKDNILRCFLNISDKISSYENEVKKELDLSFREFNYEYPFSDKTKIQELSSSSKLVKQLFIKAGTGEGKTHAALIWAKRLKDKKKIDRVVFCLPTIFTANMTYNNIENSKILHSEVENDDSLIFTFLNKVFYSGLTVSTIDQLLKNFLLYKEENRISLVNLSTSLVIIDEIDFYDIFSINAIKKAISFLEKLGAHILIMSATLSNKHFDFMKITDDNLLIMSDYDENIKYRLNTIFNVKTRPETEFSENSIQHTFKNFLSKNIVYANTIRNCFLYYKAIKKYFGENTDYEIILYHSNFIYSDKKKKEKLIYSKFSDSSNVILITSQISEISLNISADYILTELCPIDRLIQRLGRLKRFNKELGFFDVIIPQYYNNKLKKVMDFCNPYAVLDKDNFTFYETRVFNETKKRLKEGFYSKKDLDNIIQNVYNKDINESIEDEKLKIRINQNNKNFDLHITDSYYFNNYLTDNLENSFWQYKLEDDNQKLLITDLPKKIYGLRNVNDFISKNSVSIPLYRIKRGLKNDFLNLVKDKIYGEDVTYYKLLNKSLYDSDLGLNFF